jgi:hypothetical protein
MWVLVYFLEIWEIMLAITYMVCDAVQLSFSGRAQHDLHGLFRGSPDSKLKHNQNSLH